MNTSDIHAPNPNNTIIYLYCSTIGWYLLMWRLRLPLRLKFLWQMWQEYGFSPVWTSMCILSAALHWRVFEHNGQVLSDWVTNSEPVEQGIQKIRTKKQDYFYQCYKPNSIISMHFQLTENINITESQLQFISNPRARSKLLKLDISQFLNRCQKSDKEITALLQ